MSINDFLKHFKSVCGEGNSNDEEMYSDFDHNDDIFEELNVSITEGEILNAIKGLKRNKSHGSDGMLNEYFIEYTDILLPFLYKILNAMLDTGVFPSVLCDALIVPVHKKGSMSDPKNYRGISLTSCLCKLFTSIVSRRLLSWSEDNDVITDAQFGFRPHYGTVDAIFALNTIISKYLKSKRRLYCCFIDCKQAFDSVDRIKLWHKVSKLGMRGNILAIIKSLYCKIKTSVLLDGKISHSFINSLCVLQGEIISPILYSFYVNDCEMDFLRNGCEPTELQELSLYLLMYADDTVIFSESVSGLQNMLVSLQSYTEKWSLAVNVTKTKVMVFRNGGNVRPQESLLYNGEEIDIVDEFCYLGIVFNYNDKFYKTQKQLSLQCRKAMFAMKRKCSDMTLNYNTLLSLFDTYVSSIANYGYEIWGLHSSPDIEKVHLDYCKNILGVKRPNSMVYCELGRLPLIFMRKVRIVKYWLKLQHTNNCILKASWYFLFNEFCQNPNVKNWVAGVYNILAEIGLGDIFYNYGSLECKHVLGLVKQRLTDIYNQSIMSEVNNPSKSYMYKHLIDHVTLQPYLSKPIYCQYKKLICI